MHSFLMSNLGGLIVGLFTISGAFLGLLGRKAERSSTLISIDFALGMMIGAAGFSMIWPSASEVASQGFLRQILFLGSLIFGYIFIQGVGSIMERKDPGNRVWLFVVAMCLHNIPEGVAAGVALSELGLDKSLPLIGLIGIQNVPEGLICFVAFEALGFSRSKALMAAAATGLFEVLGGFSGGLAVQFFQNITPLLLGFAGSAMLVVSIKEMRDRVKNGMGALTLRHAFTGFATIAIFQLVMS